MLRCIAIDDEPLALRQVRSYIEKIPYLELAGACDNALDAQQFLSTHPVDLIFADIDMPDLNGVDFVRSPTSAVRPPRPTRFTNCGTTSVRRPRPRSPKRRRRRRTAGRSFFR